MGCIYSFHPWPNFNGDKVRAWMNNYTQYETMDAIYHAWPDLTCTTLAKWTTKINSKERHAFTWTTEFINQCELPMYSIYEDACVLNVIVYFLVASAFFYLSNQFDLYAHILEECNSCTGMEAGVWLTSAVSWKIIMTSWHRNTYTPLTLCKEKPPSMASNAELWCFLCNLLNCLLSKQ